MVLIMSFDSLCSFFFFYRPISVRLLQVREPWRFKNEGNESVLLDELCAILVV